jgi:hypothetical protein
MALTSFLERIMPKKGDGDMDLNDEASYPGITTSGYGMGNLPDSVEGKVRSVSGWSTVEFQTYQDGICADFNYGKCLSPTAQRNCFFEEG